MRIINKKGIDMEATYRNLWNSDVFSDIYRYNRSQLYDKLFSIIKELNVTTVLDIGCAYGQLVSTLNDSQINAFGIDLPIEKIIEYHHNSKWRDKFIYGSILDCEFALRVSQIRPNLVCLIDTFRCLEPEAIIKFIELTKSDYILVKEVSNTLLMRYKRRNQREIGLISPNQLLTLLPRYKPYKIYVSRFLASFSNPGIILMHLINMISPTYSLILKRKG